jgi:hypothetical protein
MNHRERDYGSAAPKSEVKNENLMRKTMPVRVLLQLPKTGGSDEENQQKNKDRPNSTIRKSKFLQQLRSCENSGGENRTGHTWSKIISP